MLGIFKSKEQDTIEQVRGKLAKAQQAVTLAIQEQRAQSLAVALSDDENAGRPIAEKIQQLRGRVELLEQALILAEENEARRLAKARAEAEKSRNLAIRAHIGTLVKAALKYQVATYNSVLAWRDMLAAGESIAKLLPADRALAEAVSYSYLRRLCEEELSRVGAPDLIIAGNRRPAAPGAETRLLSRRPDEETPLADKLKISLLQMHGWLTGETAERPPQPEQPAMLPRGAEAAIAEHQALHAVAAELKEVGHTITETAPSPAGASGTEPSTPREAAETAPSPPVVPEQPVISAPVEPAIDAQRLEVAILAGDPAGLNSSERKAYDSLTASVVRDEKRAVRERRQQTAPAITEPDDHLAELAALPAEDDE